MSDKSNWNFSEETLKSMIARIQKRLDDNVKESKTNDIYSIGVVDGMKNALDMIRNDLEGRNLNPRDFGLN
ncbi:hypothetical protein [Levyella massiliensis]|uniref:hypothetical protein n=1 Tax=Levyella massiliensis TaxID=938289 RepID=UPI0024AD2D41|nr:hypothetical protein [Levyella massiliensis]